MKQATGESSVRFAQGGGKATNGKRKIATAFLGCALSVTLIAAGGFAFDRASAGAEEATTPPSVYYLEKGATYSLYNTRKGSVMADMDCINVKTVADLTGVSTYQNVGITTEEIGEAVTETDYLAIDLQNCDDAAWRTFYVEVNGLPCDSGVEYYMINRLGEVSKKTTNDGNRGVITERYIRFSNATSAMSNLEGFYGTAVIPLSGYAGVTEIEKVSVYSTSKDKSYARFNVGTMRVLSRFSETDVPEFTDSQIIWAPAADNFVSYAVQGEDNKTDLYTELSYMKAGDFKIGARTDAVKDYDSFYITLPQSMIGADGYVDFEALGVKGMVMDVKNFNLTQTGFAIRIAGNTHSSLGDTKEFPLWQTSIASGYQSKVIYKNGLVRTRVPGFLPYDESGEFDGSVYIPFSSDAFTSIGGEGGFPTKIHPVMRLFMNNLDKSGLTADQTYDVNISNVRFVTDDTPYQAKLITLTGMGGVIAGSIGERSIGSGASVLSGTKVDFRVTPNAGYRIESVTCSSGGDSLPVTVGADGSFQITVTDDVTIVYYCEEIAYNITYDLGGGTNSDMNPEVYYASSGKLPLYDAEKEGDEFLGWQDENGRWIYEIDSSLAKDVTLKAIWKSSGDTTTPSDGNGGGCGGGCGSSVALGAGGAITLAAVGALLLKRKKK